MEFLQRRLRQVGVWIIARSLGTARQEELLV
jgi:hypothetical protein